jgi:hypothetical protein
MMARQSAEALDESSPDEHVGTAVGRDRRIEPLIVRIEDQLLVFRDTDGYGCQGPRCVAMTRGKKRCQASVQREGAYDGWDSWMIEDTWGEVSILLPGGTELDCFITQRCRRRT